ncbi:MAG TPA: DUF5954 family protein [Yinghuangia sp.]|nr:DUF5954 family protein [Yinghuangia sp.]
MSDDARELPDHPLSVHVTLPAHPVAAAQEADAVDAARRFGHFVIRGPVFGLGARHAGERGWRVLTPITDGCAQEARDSLNSRLWFRAKDGTDDPVARRELLAAVARLETERVDELTVLGTQYRVVRGDEFAYMDDAGLERPRPTDPEPPEISWDLHTHGPELDTGFVIDHAAPITPMQGAERAAMRTLHYRAPSYPVDVRADSARALSTHPGVVLLPPAFCVVEETDNGWEPVGPLKSTPHGARRTLDYLLTEAWPKMREITGAEHARHLDAAARFRAAGRANRLDVDGRRYRIARISRLVRVGPDGPEMPRPSDYDPYPPIKMHPTMDEYGTITHEGEKQGD